MDEHILVCLSAGVESTAYLSWAVNNYKKVTAINVVVSTVPTNKPWMNNHSIQRLSAEKICDFFNIRLIKTDIVHTNLLESNNIMVPVHQRPWIAFHSCLATLCNRDITRVFGACFCREDRDEASTYEKRKFPISESKKYYENLYKAMGSSAKLEWPDHLESLTKKELLSTIPSDITKYLVTCFYKNKITDIRCNMCTKCLEWNTRLSTDFNK